MYEEAPVAVETTENNVATATPGKKLIGLPSSISLRYMGRHSCSSAFFVSSVPSRSETSVYQVFLHLAGASDKRG